MSSVQFEQPRLKMFLNSTSYDGCKLKSQIKLKPNASWNIFIFSFPQSENETKLLFWCFCQKGTETSSFFLHFFFPPVKKILITTLE